MNYIIYNENQLLNNLSDNELLNLWKNEQNQLARITLAKRNHNLVGDVYYINGFLCDASHHRTQFPNTTATTIEEMAQEQIAYMEEQERLAQSQSIEGE